MEDEEASKPTTSAEADLKESATRQNSANFLFDEEDGAQIQPLFNRGSSGFERRI
eukprot:SAG31_NODE_19286_length_607_cov_0.907480_1_plen_54_part_01